MKLVRIPAVNLFCIFFCQRHHFYVFSLLAEYHGILDSFHASLFRIDKPFCAVFKRDSDILPLEGAHQLVDHNGKTNGRGRFSKRLQQVIITSALHNSLAASESITGKDYAGIIIQPGNHRHFIGDILLHSVGPEQIFQLLQSLQGAVNLRVICRPLLCLYNLFPGQHDILEKSEQIIQIFIQTTMNNHVFHAIKIPVQEKFTDLHFRFLSQICRLEEPFQEINVSHTDLELL